MPDRSSSATQSRPGEIVLTKLDIYNYDKSRKISLLPQFLSLNIIEDMFKPTVYGHIVIQDPVDFLTQFPFLGEERLEVEFYCPYRGDTDFKRKFEFYCYGIDGYSPDITSRNTVYTIKFISVEQLENSKKLLSRNYKGKAHEIIQKILNNGDFLNSSKQFIHEDTTDDLSYTLPKLTCFETIEFFRNRAYTKASDQNSPEKSNDFFVFYENSEGFNFKSIGKLIKDGFDYNKKLADQKIFNELYYTDFSSEMPVTELDKQVRNVSMLTYVAHSDTFSAFRNGGIKNRVYTYDFATREFIKYDFKLADAFDNFLHLDDTNDQVTSGIRYSDQLLADVKDEHEPRDIYIPINSLNVGDVKLYQRTGFSVAYLDNLSKSPLKVSFYGDPVLRAGDIVDLKIPEFTGATEGRTQHRYQSGNYLVGRLVHTIESTQNHIYKMNADLFKESFKLPIKPNPDISLPVQSNVLPFLGVV